MAGAGFVGPKRYSVGYNNAFLSETPDPSEYLRRYVSTSHLNHRAAIRSKIVATNRGSSSCTSSLMLAGKSLSGGFNGKSSSPLRQRQVPPKVLFLLGGPASGVEEICSRLSNTFQGLVLLCHPNASAKVSTSLLRKQIEENSTVTSFLVENYPRTTDEYDEWLDQMGGQTDDFCFFLDISKETLLKRVTEPYIHSCPGLPNPDYARASSNATVEELMREYERMLPVVQAWNNMRKLRNVIADVPLNFETIYEEVEYAMCQMLRPRYVTSHPTEGVRMKVNSTFKAPFLRPQVPLETNITSPYVSPRLKEITKDFHIFHFNDVYNIEDSPGDKCGGIARFMNVIEDFRMAHPHVLVLFSGDAFSPSILSSVTRGTHMVKALNAISVDCAVFGNHDFDFGLHDLEELTQDCNFPWLMSNVWYKPTDSFLARGLEHKIININGVKVGLIGLAEEEWLTTLFFVDQEDCIFEDPVTAANRLAKKLKDEPFYCDMVIALTHMRIKNDQHLAENCPDLDLILGGHDHHYEVREVPPHGTLLVKSGQDFHEATTISVKVGKNINFKWEKKEINRLMKPHPAMVDFVEEEINALLKKIDQVIGSTSVLLDSRYQIVRSQESNVGNFITDCIRSALSTDMCLINGGCIRYDAILNPGPITIKHILNWLPGLSDLRVLKIKGSTLIKALECGVSMVPRMEGRFPQVSGIKFIYDPNAPPFHRIQTVLVNKQEYGDLSRYEEIEPNRSYSLACPAYIANGRDGYSPLTEATLERDEESCATMQILVQNHFKMQKIANLFHTMGIKAQGYCGSVPPSGQRAAKKFLASIGKKRAEILTNKGSICSIEPEIEGRILTVAQAAHARAMS